MMNNYETVFILTPDLSDVQMKEAVEKYTNLLTENGGEIVNREEWGMRKLAYPIKKKSTGYYVLIEFKSEPSFIKTFEIHLRRDDNVIRFLTFRQDTFALEYAEKRRQNRINKPIEETQLKEKKAIKDIDDYEDDESEFELEEN